MITRNNNSIGMTADRQINHFWSPALTSRLSQSLSQDQNLSQADASYLDYSGLPIALPSLLRCLLL